MTPRQPRVTGKDLVTTLGRLGFEVVRVRGIHHFLRHQDGRVSVVPVHRNEILGPGLFGKILHDCEISVKQLGEVL